MEALARRCGIHNTDLRYYRDKYVGLLFVFSMLGAIAVFADWPLPHAELVHGAKLLVVAIICIALSRYRIVLLGAMLAFIAVRLVWGAIIYHWWEGFVLGLVARAVTLALVLGRLSFKGDYSFPYRFEPYSIAEFAIDMVVFVLMLSLLRMLAA